MKHTTFQEWLNASHPELIIDDRIDLEELQRLIEAGLLDKLGKYGRRAALPLAMTLGATALGGGQTKTPYSYNVQGLKGDQQARDKYAQDLANYEKPGGSLGSQVSQTPTQINSFTQIEESSKQIVKYGVESAGVRTEMIDVIETKNVDEGTIIVIEMSGTIMAGSEEEAKQLIEQKLKEQCQQNGIHLQDVQDMGGGMNWDVSAEAIDPRTYAGSSGRPMPVKMRITILIPQGKVQ